MSNNKKALGNIFIYVLMFVSAAIFVLIASATTSPLYPNYKGWDSGLFQVIGKGWLQGHVPYKELYDQKGPAIFFISTLGYAIAGSEIGVFIIQIAFMFASECIIYKICNRVFKDWAAFLIAALGIFVFACNYEFGNLCEEYCNPLLLASMYLVTRWIDNKNSGENSHNPLYAFVYGITFGFSMMTRLTNAIGVCVAVFFIMLYLIFKKEFANLLKNAVGFILGTALIVAPFMIYFAVKGATYDFWYGTLLYNIAYATNSKGGIMTVIKGAAGQIGSYAIMAAGIICIIRKKYFDGTLYFSLGAATEVLLMNIMNYGHYSMITFAYLPIAIYALKKNIDECKDDTDSLGKLTTRLAIIVMAGVVLIAGARTGKEMLKLKNYYNRYYADSQANAVLQYKQLLDVVGRIPEEDRNSIVGYGTNPWFYLDMDITPACKFFVMQDWQAEFSEDFRSKLVTEFEARKPKWIVYSNAEESSIGEILSSYYEVYSIDDVIGSNDASRIILYKLK
ncbi:glycosyltransferase family 39 protein [Butyrivibrio sp. AE3009]|uniref:glycosyltransferase family 39 protein n=1 Tax=Butyrivibrio sp. AE3009 TaxID=1280666 RepID=UPI0003B731D0|nr:glycosyltransferase family 39 protein [Butyrivibrio sp. AE3009]